MFKFFLKLAINGEFFRFRGREFHSLGTEELFLWRLKWCFIFLTKIFFSLINKNSDIVILSIFVVFFKKMLSCIHFFFIKFSKSLYMNFSLTEESLIFLSWRSLLFMGSSLFFVSDHFSTLFLSFCWSLSPHILQQP